ncbi:MAG: hypothetical protein Q9214_001068, partial [Letrouitia sp. 1 TL-2023]
AAKDAATLWQLAASDSWCLLPFSFPDAPYLAKHVGRMCVALFLDREPLVCQSMCPRLVAPMMPSRGLFRQHVASENTVASSILNIDV